MRRRSSSPNSAVMLATYRKLAKSERFESGEVYAWEEDDSYHIEAEEVQSVLREIRAHRAPRLDANPVH